MAGKLPKGENSLVIGGGSVGCEGAEYLPDKGKKVSVVEILDQLACDAQSDARKLLAQRLKEKGVTLYTRSKVQKVDGEKTIVVNSDGKSLELWADVVVADVGAIPDPPSLRGIERLKPAPAVYFIGDCRQAGEIRHAIHDGNRVGRLI